MECTLCKKQDNFEIIQGPDNRFFYKCNNCFLIFSDPTFLLNRKDEENRYKLHRNTINDVGYVNFLNKSINPALNYINQNMIGLDFGCGPEPTLSKLLKKYNIKCDDYDPIFFPEIDYSKKYDFIFATECFEHFYNPLKEMNLIDSLLNNNGYLIIMTELWNESINLKKWYYSQDKTHVCFFQEKTFNYIKSTFKYKLIFNDNKSVIIIKKDSRNCLNF